MSSLTPQSLFLSLEQLALSYPADLSTFEVEPSDILNDVDPFAADSTPLSVPVIDHVASALDCSSLLTIAQTRSLTSAETSKLLSQLPDPSIELTSDALSDMLDH